MKARGDKSGGGILLGDNTGDGAVGFDVSGVSALYKNIVDGV